MGSSGVKETEEVDSLSSQSYFLTRAQREVSLQDGLNSEENAVYEGGHR